jgi:3-deoxy-manno-octulosonate cytidylyltransferase (CMP-KDO synthetase)
MEEDRQVHLVGDLKMKVVIVIPCRWGSSRFPGKPLAPLLTKPLIQHVYERASYSKKTSRVIIATDDTRIEQAVKAFGGEVMMTGAATRTGSDRAAELIDTHKADVYINLQGDELIKNPEILDDLIVSFTSVPSLRMGTLKHKLIDPNEIMDPNVVKVVTDKDGFALYFSRSPIPFVRDDSAKAVPATEHQMPKKIPTSGSDYMLQTYYKHLGIYIFERETLRLFSTLRTGHLESFEKLEQLRAIENGIRIKVWETKYESFRIDSQKDLQTVEGQIK